MVPMLGKLQGRSLRMEDEVSFSISFSDFAGNTGSNGSGGAIVSATTSGSVVTIDRTGPTISTVDIATDNSRCAVCCSS